MTSAPLSVTISSGTYDGYDGSASKSIATKASGR